MRVEQRAQVAAGAEGGMIGLLTIAAPTTSAPNNSLGTRTTPKPKIAISFFKSLATCGFAIMIRPSRPENIFEVEVLGHSLIAHRDDI